MAEARTADTDPGADSRAPSVRVALDGEDMDAEVAALVRHWSDSAARSAERRRERRERRRERRRARVARVVTCALVAAGIGGVVLAATHLPSPDGLDEPVALEPPRASLPGAFPTQPQQRTRGRERAVTIPGRDQLQRARAFARSRDGLASFAVVDSRGNERSLYGDRRYVSASVVKAMLLVAEVDRLRAAAASLDATTRGQLEAMITYSDNAAADAVYNRVGDAGLYAVARRAGMRRFSVSGYWANAQLTASDMARMFGRLDELITGPNRVLALGLLGSVIPAQSWGIPAAAGDQWAIRFKGGWRSTERGQLVHQVAELRDGDRKVSLAVLTDGQPTQAYGIETVRGVAERLLSDPHRQSRDARERP